MAVEDCRSGRDRRERDDSVIYPSSDPPSQPPIKEKSLPTSAVGRPPHDPTFPVVLDPLVCLLCPWSGRLVEQGDEWNARGTRKECKGFHRHLMAHAGVSDAERARSPFLSRRTGHRVRTWQPTPKSRHTMEKFSRWRVRISRFRRYRIVAADSRMHRTPGRASSRSLLPFQRHPTRRYASSTGRSRVSHPSVDAQSWRSWRRCISFWLISPSGWW